MRGRYKGDKRYEEGRYKIKREIQDKTGRYKLRGEVGMDGGRYDVKQEGIQGKMRGRYRVR